jgi:hypothetical protein
VADEQSVAVRALQRPEQVGGLRDRAIVAHLAASAICWTAAAYTVCTETPAASATAVIVVAR